MTAQMIDAYGRSINYLRLSVTDRCNFRCAYCMAEDTTVLPRSSVLSLEELSRVCQVFVDKGVKRIRITGGEPLVRKGLMAFIANLGRRIGSNGGLDELTLTTNGSLLSKYAGDLFASGVRRVNISLDTLDPAKFRNVSRWGELRHVTPYEQVIATREIGAHHDRFCWNPAQIQDDGVQARLGRYRRRPRR